MSRTRIVLIGVLMLALATIVALGFVLSNGPTVPTDGLASTSVTPTVSPSTSATPTVPPSASNHTIEECVAANEHAYFEEDAPYSLEQLCQPWVDALNGELRDALSSPEGFDFGAAPTEKGQLYIMVSEKWREDVRQWAAQYGGVVIITDVPDGFSG